MKNEKKVVKRDELKRKCNINSNQIRITIAITIKKFILDCEPINFELLLSNFLMNN